MSRPQKETIKISEHGVITEEAMIAYLHNGLTTEEKQQFEKLLADDPFAQEALEGLRLVGDKEKLSASISSVKAKVNERLGAKEHKVFALNWMTYAVAASILGLLIGVGFFMVSYFGKNNQQMATNEQLKSKDQSVNVVEQKPQEQKTEPVTLPPVDTATISQRPPGMENIPTVTQEAEKSKLEKQIAENKATDKDSKNKEAATKTTQPNPVTNATNSTLLANNKNTAPTGAINNATGAAQKTNQVAVTNSPVPSMKKDEKAALERSNGFSQSGANANAPSQQDVNAAEKAEGSSADETANIDDAMKNFNSGDYKKSADQFDKILKHDPDNADALYFGGVSDYINGKEVKSEKSFDKVLKKGTRYIEGAKWYKANILLKKGKKDEAKGLLQDLANTNSSYKERAIKKLAEIQF